MSACVPHREYLGALADGEKELVPAATIEHVNQCVDCSREIQAHRMLTSRLREASAHTNGELPQRIPASAGRRRLATITAAAAVVLALVAVAVGWTAFSRPDPVQAAVAASSQPFQIQSTDPNQVGDWCLKASGRGLPAIQLDGMQVVGARMDRVPSTDIVTVVYITPSGAQVTVSWLEGQAPGGSGVEERDVSGHHVLLVHTTSSTVVVGGSSTAAMWQAAAAIESTLA